VSNDGDVVKGEIVSKEAEAYFASLRAFFDPKSAADRLDAYGKWLFASAAIVGSLGAGLSNSSFSHLRGLGVVLFAVAIVALGGCLIAASLSVAPHWIKAKIDDPASMQAAVLQEFETRRYELNWAARLFAFALLLAALCPLLSLIAPRNAPVLHFAVDEKGVVDMGVEISGEKEGKVVDLHLEAKPVDGTTMPRATTTIDHDGQAKLNIRFSSYNLLPPNSSLVLCIGVTSGNACTDQKKVLLKP
jgi:hypothetical protein